MSVVVCPPRTRQSDPRRFVVAVKQHATALFSYPRPDPRNTMDHVLITRRRTKLPSAAARPFVWFATLFMSGVITGLHLMSGLRRFRPGGSASSAPVTPDELTQSQVVATTEQAPTGLAAIGLADNELAGTGLADTALAT